MKACPTVQRDFHRLVNMGAAEIRSWAKDPRAKCASFPETRARLPMLASLKAQGEFMRPTEQQQQAVRSTANAAAPLFQAWQSVFTAPMQSGSTFAPRHH